MTSSELRNKYLKFFEKNGHKIVPSASLIPENDPTVLFTTAGMHPLVPFLLGEKHPSGKRLTDAQKCIRTGDIDDVGDDTHLTFFEMLGNWSLGDYWKEDAIKWSFEFLTKELDISLEKLAFTCFGGDKRVPQIPKDEESAKIWESLGIKKERIAFLEGGVLESTDNWWGPAGETGPCGPDTEMFYWKDNNEKAPDFFDSKDKRWVEIWNDVFMQYVKDEKGNFLPAKQKNVDTGMGLERTLAVLNGKENVYETDVFTPIIEKIEELSGKTYQENKKEFRVIADHIKASVFLVCEGIVPSNVKQGYVLRRLLRRAIGYGRTLKIPSSFLVLLAEKVIDIYGDSYPELNNNKEKIFETIKQEEEKFEKTIEAGLSELDRVPNLTGEIAFDLYQSHGLPLEVSKEIFSKKTGKNIENENDFWVNLQKHQELSRTASAGMFKGGLADASEKTTKLHTAAHLMLAGLRKTLGEHVSQKGSNITAERLRFDFSHKEKMTSEQIKEVEDFVNNAIESDLPVEVKEMTLEEAKSINATGVFESKYGERVKVYTIGKDENIVSREICGGPHVEQTGDLGKFKIVKEESSSSGVRRIKAILE